MQQMLLVTLYFQLQLYLEVLYEFWLILTMSQMKSTIYLSNFCLKGSQRLWEPPSCCIESALKCYGSEQMDKCMKHFSSGETFPMHFRDPGLKSPSQWLFPSPLILPAPPFFLKSCWHPSPVSGSSFKRAHMSTTENISDPRNWTSGMKSWKDGSKDPSAVVKSSGDNPSIVEHHTC